MDWSRAKTYLILTFLLLDFALGYQYWRQQTEQAGYVQSFSEQLAEIRELLASQKWELRAEVPKATPELAFLHVRYQSFPLEEWSGWIGEDGKLFYKGPGQVTVELSGKDVRPRPEDDGTADKILSQVNLKIWPKNLYRFDGKIQDGEGVERIRYLQIYDEYPIFSAPLELIVQGEKVTGYHLTALDVLGESGGKKQVISALHALRSLSESMDKSERRPDNKIIREIRIGYYSKPFNADEWYLIPAWRITTDREIYYVNALTGEAELAR